MCIKIGQEQGGLENPGFCINFMVVGQREVQQIKVDIFFPGITIDLLI